MWTAGAVAAAAGRRRVTPEDLVTAAVTDPEAAALIERAGGTVPAATVTGTGPDRRVLFEPGTRELLAHTLTLNTRTSMSVRVVISAAALHPGLLTGWGADPATIIASPAARPARAVQDLSERVRTVLVNELPWLRTERDRLRTLTAALVDAVQKGG